MNFYSKTDIGKKRVENQDRVWAGTLGGSPAHEDEAVAVVLCDGMGGENAGSRAAQMTVEFITERFKQGFRGDVNRNTIRNLMLTSLISANSLVWDEARSDPNKHGMGTTCVAAIIHSERAYIINVGDSRAYHIFEDCVQQITIDHTYVRTLVEGGEITEEESHYHPSRNAITRAIGAESSITPDYFEIELFENSILLLSSDGLHGNGDDASIAEIVVNNPRHKVCDLLIEYALEIDGKDNITVAIITL
jgi:protein phosphatase